MSISIYLIDDHPLVRMGLASLLAQAGYTIGGMAAGGDQALADANLSACDAVVLDLSLEDGDATGLIPQLTAHGQRVLACSMHEDATRVRKAFSAGATGYVTKRETAEHLLDAVAEVVAGRRYISPRAEAALLHDRPLEQPGVNWQCLSEREREVVRMLGEGIAAEDIARNLAISPRTVEAYYARVMSKLGIPGVKHLRRLAISASQKGELVQNS